jgi:uncharacterized membrane protein YkgB
MNMPLSRIALCVIYVWFGALKVLGTSPANPLVAHLLERTMPFMSFDTFIVFFGLFEVIIGILFLFQRLDRITIPLFGIHMVTTFMPLFLLPAITWQSVFVPTLEGQYIIKNLALIAIVLNIKKQRVIY